MNWTDSLWPERVNVSVDQKAAELRRGGYAEIDELPFSTHTDATWLVDDQNRRIAWNHESMEFYRP